MKTDPVTDNLVRGLVSEDVNALRYNGGSADRYSGTTNDPHEVIGMILSRIPEGARVLDVGCGAGAITAWIEDERHAKVIGLEPNPERAERAKQRGINVINTALSEDIVAELGLFDRVVFADVLEHIADPFEVLNITKKAISKEGSVIISVPNVAHWTIRYQLMRGRFNYTPTGIMDATHLRWFTAHTIRQLLEQAGYEVQWQSATAGTWLGNYYESPFNRLPLRRIPRQRLNKWIVKATMRYPGLFGCQHILQATPR